MNLTSVEEFQGLKLRSDVKVGSKIAAIVGRNGAGKTRLLQAIANRKIIVMIDGEELHGSRILHLSMDRLQPHLLSGFDPVQHRTDIGIAKAFYASNRGKFNIDPRKSTEVIGHEVGMGRRTQVTAHQVAHIVSRASSELGKDVNELEEEDVADYFHSAPVMGLGALNVTETMLAYWHRREQNQLHEFRNARYGPHLSYWSPEEFELRFGPPPWEVFNEFLQTALDGRYHIKPPTYDGLETYEAKLYRDDDKPIDPAWLSSGEKVLMWLCLSMYASNSGRLANMPQLLLLDEPDSALHPQMIQKLHVALNAIADRFDCNILFTTHSPTTVAMFSGGPIFQASEQELTQLDKDAAVSELLVGVDQVSIHYTNRRQVYVESHKDAEVYASLFSLLRRWKLAPSPHISLAFIPAAPKLPASQVRQLMTAHLGALNEEQLNKFITALNGQGNCIQVIGAVESLVGQGNATVHGIIDWDLSAKPQEHIHVLGADLFYSIENAILNPLTLGLYLLHNYAGKLAVEDYGLPQDFDPLLLYSEACHWQAIADGVTKKVLKQDAVNHGCDCMFLLGESVCFDRDYVHMQGHDLERRIKDTYPFLNAFNKQGSLLIDVVSRGVQSCRGRSLPIVFRDLFATIQSPC